VSLPGPDRRRPLENSKTQVARRYFLKNEIGVAWTLYEDQRRFRWGVSYAVKGRDGSVSVGGGLLTGLTWFNT
jgi:hypothetical protein